MTTIDSDVLVTVMGGAMTACKDGGCIPQPFPRPFPGPGNPFPGPRIPGPTFPGPTFPRPRPPFDGVGDAIGIAAR